ncbi:MAG: ATP-grasp domain-containing protein [Theionarchaea archaeon]|nr:ATP-grasp domain-containing protein [Theionarchaea archaeon]MBU7001156.1 ATP-grasp domain-containing protein [Theionarchaea archaeon]MBU7019935.1 ATP-grasp domain-containing protein [Theionarchaea archaeon]MBU7034027.1 ATP-grasp domain-containing protein [Theionarchaea archaeon]MBU7039562.1 ATP-grasp domain-containing protein [Theionarchaea archaeon]
MKVGIVYSQTCMEQLEEKIYADTPEMKGKTLQSIYRALKDMCEPVLMNEDRFTLPTLRKMDAVFNLSTGLNGESKQAHIPAILERLGIPYTGSGVLTHAVGLNKPKSKEVFMANKVPTPPFEILDTIQVTRNDLDGIDFPMVVKPTDGGSSRGVRKVNSYSQLKKAVKETIPKHSTVMIEPFVEGRELTVGIMGNESLDVLPILETDFKDLDTAVYDFEVKARIGYTTEHTFRAQLTPHERKIVVRAAMKAYRALHCRDYARVDIRLQDNVPYVLEINTLPGLYIGYSAFPTMARLQGLTFETLIKRIYLHAMERS